MRYISFLLLAVIPAMFMSYSNGLGQEAPVQLTIQESPVMCTAIYAPVCGVDGVTYSNECVATKQNNVKVKYEGECALPELQYCSSYYDGCNNCTMMNGQMGACTKMYCEKLSKPRCTQFVNEVNQGDTTILSQEEMLDIKEIFNNVTSEWTKLDNDDKNKRFKLLANALDKKVKEWKDFAMVASMTTEGALAHSRKIAIYAYLHFLTSEAMNSK